MKSKKQNHGRETATRRKLGTFSQAARRRAVKLVLFKKHTFAQAAEAVGCSAGSVIRWVKELGDAVRAENPNRHADMGYKPNYPEEKRVKAVKMMLYQGLSCTETAEKIGCSVTSVLSWTRQLGDSVRSETGGKPVKDHRSLCRLFPEKTKMEAARLVLVKGYSYRKAAKAVGSTATSVQNWTSLFADRIKAESPEEFKGRNRPVKMMFTNEDRMKAVQMVLVHGYSSHDAARAVGCSPGTVRSWVRRFQNGSNTAIPCPPAGESVPGFRSYPKTKREECVRAVLYEGQNCKQAADMLGCHPGTVQRWVGIERERLRRSSLAGTEPGLPDSAPVKRPKLIRNKSDLPEACRKLTGEPLSRKCAFITRHIGLHPIKTLCKHLEITEKEYHHWMNTYSEYRAKPKQNLLSRLVNTVSKQYREKIGYRKIHKILKEKGFVYTQHQVMCACQESGIADVRYSKETP